MKYFIGTSLLALQLAATPFSASLAAKSESPTVPLESRAHSQTCIARNSSGEQKMDVFVSELMAKMTLQEKIGQMNLLSVGADITGPVLSQGVEEKIDKGMVGGLFNVWGPSPVRKLQQRVMEKSRLKIPMIFGYNVIHGHRTTFPIPLGLSASWDLDLIQRTAVAAASEASADGLNWVFSPMVDITRDPRWGRVMEGAGEDPYLGSQIAHAMVTGYQGQEKMFGTDNVLACVKHFALYGAAEGGRDYNTVDMSRQRMYNEYLAPYKAAVDANVGSVMTSFNEVDGIPASGNKWLLTDLLRKQWGFKGFVATDYTAINEMVAHGVGDEKQVTALALNAGTDMDMVGELFSNHAEELVKSGKVSIKQVDDACKRILEAKYKLGLFTDPYRYCDKERARTQILSSDKIALSKEAAIKSMVLLKNDKNLLPLKSGQKLAFIGPFVKDQGNQLGSWSGAGRSEDCVSLWKALETAELTKNCSYAKGCSIINDAALIEKLNRDGAHLAVDAKSAQDLIDEAVETVKNADVAVVVLGEPAAMSGEASSRTSIGLFNNQVALLQALKKTRKPIVLLLMNGRPLTLTWEEQNMDAILETWFGGLQAGPATVDVLFGRANPSAKLSMTFPRNVGQIPIYYNAKNTGRPFLENSKYHSQYLDVSNAPLYPFGYGLSYSQFEYSDVSLSSPTMKAEQSLNVSATVSNSSKVDGVETVQLYIRDLVASVTRPVKELKGFQKVALKAGESKTVSFTLKSHDLTFYDSELKSIAEPGDFKVFIGGNSRDTKEASFKLLAP
jgi:beta-glucosidase